MVGPLLATIWVALAFVLYKTIAYVLEELRHARNAKRLGCQQPLPFRTERWDVLGILSVTTAVKAFKAQALPQLHKQFVEAAEEREGWNVRTFRNVSAFLLCW